MGWSLAFAHDDFGRRTEGEKSHLIEAVRNGYPVRFLIFQEDNCQYITDAQCLWVWKDNVYAQNSSQVSVDNYQRFQGELRPVYPSAIARESADPEGEFLLGFQDSPYWWMIIADTQGNLDMTRWSIGSDEARGRDQQRVAMKWFVNSG